MPETPSPFQPESHLPDQNIEMQRLLLQHMQREISAGLFESGAVTAILGQAQASQRGGRPQQLEGTDLLDRMYLPTVVNIGDAEIPREEVSLTLAMPDPQTGEARPGTRYPVGTIDSAGIFVPSEGVDPQAAEQVVEAVGYLRQAKANGELRQLSASLLGINDVRYAIGRFVVKPPEATT
ncbi:MAG: hypothetical protein KIH63_005040 [Candidatus Saccharibacteria bacterium]|nr:hypothetical protein [Candidatus Saccharibacteria bacterium]